MEKSSMEGTLLWTELRQDRVGGDGGYRASNGGGGSEYNRERSDGGNGG